jgi:GTP cyclohydrolase II
MKLVSKTVLTTALGDFDFMVFGDSHNKDPQLNECIVMGSGDYQNKSNVLMRLHDRCITSEIFNSLHCDCRMQLEFALRMIKEQGGLLIYTYQEGRNIGLAQKIKAYELRRTLNLNTYESHNYLNLPLDARRYDFVKDILNYLNISSVKLLSNNPEKEQKLKKLGVKVIKMIDLSSEYYYKSLDYIREKALAMGHSGLGVFFYELNNHPESCFSSFYPVEIHLDEFIWKSAEQYYQAQKFDPNKNRDIFMQIVNTLTPQQAAQIAEQNKAHYREDWADIKIAAMQKVVIAKFKQNAGLQEILLNTLERPIYENSPDDFWGIGRDSKGKNYLGILLMETRSLIQKEIDSQYMDQCILLAQEEHRKTSKNLPLIGCVIVKNKKIVAKGYYAKNDALHVAAKLLKSANSQAENATLYMNLEPCSLKPNSQELSCVEQIVESGISRVVVGMLDPNPEINHQGVAKLMAQGITVKVGILKKACQAINQNYIKKFS